MNQERFDMLEKFMTDHYELTPDGIFSKKSNRIIATRVTNLRRHPYVTLASKDVHPRPQKYPIHEIVGYYKFGKDIVGMTIDHKDNNPLNYSWDNLQLMSLRDNVKKQENSYIKLTVDDVKVIKRLLAEGKTQQSIANQFGVSRSQIEKIKLGKRWKEVII